MSLDEMKDLVRQAGELRTRSVVFTGGEPTLLNDDLINLLLFIRDESPIPSTRLVTNGAWAVSDARARELLGRWQEAGLVEVNISCGEFHQELIPLTRVVNAYRAARGLGYATVLLAGEFLAPGKGEYSPERYRQAVGEPLLPPELASPYVSRVRGLSCGSALSYGRGKDSVRREDLRLQEPAELPGLCSDVLGAVTAHPTGETTACCGVMVREPSLLNIGNWRTQRLRPMLEAAHRDLILNWIRYLGLRDMRQWLQAQEPSLELRGRYASICDLCAEMLYDRRCQELLTTRGHERRDDILVNKVALEAALGQPERLVYDHGESRRA
jgi:hypothetical protein